MKELKKPIGLGGNKETAMHSVQITLIANQTIQLLGHEVNVHDIYSIVVDHEGRIKRAYIDVHTTELQAIGED